MFFPLESKVKEKLHSGKHFIVIGRAGLDLYPTPAGTKTADAKLFTSDLGGSAANIAVSLSLLGSQVKLLSCFSKDCIGDFVKKKLTHYKVNIEYCRSVPGQNRNSLAIAESFPTNPNVVIYRNNASDLLLSKDQVDKVNFHDACGLIITGTSLSSEPSRSAVKAAINLAIQNNCPIILDLDYRPDAWSNINDASKEITKVAISSNICLGNKEEFNIISSSKNLTGKKYAQFLAKNNILVFYKKGEKGCEIISKDFSKNIEVYKVKGLKPFGAGDAFIGTLLHSLTKGLDVLESSLRANAAAAIVVRRVGCSSAMPKSNEIDKFLLKYKRI